MSPHDSHGADLRAGIRTIEHGIHLDDEAIQMMADLGMTPTQVWGSTTRVAAELMGVADELGTLEVGKIADAVVFDGTDLDVSDLHPRVARVVQSGALVG